LTEMMVLALRVMLALDRMETLNEEDEAAEEAAGVGANLVNEFGINEEQLHNIILLLMPTMYDAFQQNTKVSSRG
jgi:hypothetical protein